jgi:tRNA 2-thiocytidine biosynthesis protein TtcA
MSQRSLKYAVRHLLKAVHRAIRQYGLINPGDGVLVAVSGGWDSLSLLNILLDLHRSRVLDCHLVAAHVFPGWPPVSHPDSLRAYFDKLRVPFIVDESIPLKDLDLIKEGKSICFQCARSRRQRLFQMAMENGCRKIAMAHHREDVLETLMINLFERGRASALVPFQELFGGQIAIVRPFYAVEERRIKAYARLTGLPLFNYQCLINSNSHRTYWKKHLQLLEQQRPGAKASLFQAIHQREARFLPPVPSPPNRDFHETPINPEG